MSGYRLPATPCGEAGHDWVAVPPPWAGYNLVPTQLAPDPPRGTYVQCARCAKQEFHTNRFYPARTLQ